jgi:hypothetical protein
MQVIIRRSMQWGRIELRISARDSERFNAVSGPFPVLRTLAIETMEQVSNYVHPIVPSLNLEILHHAPVLQYCTISFKSAVTRHAPLSITNFGRCHASLGPLLNLQVVTQAPNCLKKKKRQKRQNFRFRCRNFRGVTQKIGGCRNVE